MSVPAADRDRLRALAEAKGAELEGAHPAEILGWAAVEFGDALCVTSSMGDGLVAHLAARAMPGIDVIFLDTGYHFAETIGTRDAVAATLPVTLVSVTPRQSVAEQDARYGPRLYERDPDRCCALRKVEPLARALAPYHAWASGVRRDEAVTRRAVRVVEWDERRGLVKVNPLAAWTQAEVDRYVAAHGVLVNPLTDDGYPSIGCAPCTRRVAPGEGSRSGRWAGQGKTECGLHG
ncbi:MAG TPA: phosphoadenylyl-sulfate reductase [Mycobacteriales bacterium]|nr:phosphoadenylyl-sulfate reductase [Mycobacteriales bacterium]